MYVWMYVQRWGVRYYFQWSLSKWVSVCSSLSLYISFSAVPYLSVFLIGWVSAYIFFVVISVISTPCNKCFLMKVWVRDICCIYCHLFCELWQKCCQIYTSMSRHIIYYAIWAIRKIQTKPCIILLFRLSNIHLWESADRIFIPPPLGGKGVYNLIWSNFYCVIGGHDYSCTSPIKCTNS